MSVKAFSGKMKKMKSSVLSAREFFQLTVNSLLELVCTHCIDGHRIVSIEGRLLLALDTGDKVDLNIHQQDVTNMSKAVKTGDKKKSSSVSYLHYFVIYITHQSVYNYSTVSKLYSHQAGQKGSRQAPITAPIA